MFLVNGQSPLQKRKGRRKGQGVKKSPTTAMLLEPQGEPWQPPVLNVASAHTLSNSAQVSPMRAFHKHSFNTPPSHLDESSGRGKADSDEHRHLKPYY